MKETQFGFPMPNSESAPWKIYREYVCPLPSRLSVGLTRNRALARYKYGDALWLTLRCFSTAANRSDTDHRQPGPIYSYKRVRIGDVGYISRGRFHLLFSAGIPLGSRTPGTDVPHTFEPLDVGPIILGDVRPPGYLRTDTVQQIGVDVGGSAAVAWCVCTYCSLVNNRRD